MTTPPPIQLIDNDLVEVQFAGEWGLICIFGNMELTSAICRQLGYSGGATTGETIDVTGRKAWMRKADCPDDAARIDQCDLFAVEFENCSFSKQIQCEGKIIVN